MSPETGGAPGEIDRRETAPPPENTIAPDADRQFRRLDTAFRRAREDRPEASVEAHYALGGRPVRVRVAGRDLASDVDRAIRHLRLDAPPGDRPALTVDLWDESETGVSCAGCVAGDDLNAPGSFSVSPDGRYVVTERAQTKTVLDRRDQRIVGWVGDRDELTLYELGRPLHTELLQWHRDHGLLAVHAGLVARRDEGVLFGGPGGSGKSTVALTCLLAGFDYLADDYVGVEGTDDEAFRGHSLYGSTHLEPGHLDRFPELEPHAIPGTLPREDKSLVLLSDRFGDRLARSARIRALALPTVVDAERSAIRPASPVETLKQLAPSSLLLLPYAGVGKEAFERLTEMARRLPTFWLELGRDLDGIPGRVDEILERAKEEA